MQFISVRPSIEQLNAISARILTPPVFSLGNAYGVRLMEYVGKVSVYPLMIADSGERRYQWWVTYWCWHRRQKPKTAVTHCLLNPWFCYTGDRTHEISEYRTRQNSTKNSQYFRQEGRFFRKHFEWYFNEL
jgi:hypothetical protein